MTPPLSRAEARLGSFCRFFGVLYLAGAAIFAAAPTLVYRLASMGDPGQRFGPEALFWNALGVASMVATGVACFVTAHNPRTMRHALLPVIAAKATTSALAFVHLGAGRAFTSLALADLALTLVTLLVYRASAPGVHTSQAAQPAKPESGEAARAPVQLGVPK